MRLDEFLTRHFPDAIKRGKGYFACCRCHNEKTASLEISEGKDGAILCHCFGCGADGKQICAALGIDVKELFANAAPKRKKRAPATAKPLTVAELAMAKQLPEEFLREQGIEDFPDGSGIAIPYFEMDGSQAARLRKRTALRAGDGSSWVGPMGVAVIPYGLWKLGEWW